MILMAILFDTSRNNQENPLFVQDLRDYEQQQTICNHLVATHQA